MLRPSSCQRQEEQDQGFSFSALTPHLLKYNFILRNLLGFSSVLVATSKPCNFHWTTWGKTTWVMMGESEEDKEREERKKLLIKKKKKERGETRQRKFKLLKWGPCGHGRCKQPPRLGLVLGFPCSTAVFQLMERTDVRCIGNPQALWEDRVMADCGLCLFWSFRVNFSKGHSAFIFRPTLAWHTSSWDVVGDPLWREGMSLGDFPLVQVWELGRERAPHLCLGHTLFLRLPPMEAHCFKNKR